jgi:hypothetical protein
MIFDNGAAGGQADPYRKSLVMASVVGLLPIPSLVALSL